ncbi:MAG: hypothetical protein JWN30_923, partial [Bacilli bacterium]|nr:hypothetical protein [Bacilli bacterium]
LMNDMPIGPLVFRSQAFLTKPFVHDLVSSASGVEFNVDYTWIQGRKK